MQSTTTARPSKRLSSSSTRTDRNQTKSNNTGSPKGKKNSKPGKSGGVPSANRPKAGAPQAQTRDIPKTTIKEMKSLHALGIAMTNIHRIVQQKPGLKTVRYYDVWKALRTE